MTNLRLIRLRSRSSAVNLALDLRAFFAELVVGCMRSDTDSGVSIDFALAMYEVLIASVTGSDFGDLVVVEAHLGDVTG